MYLVLFTSHVSEGRVALPSSFLQKVPYQSRDVLLMPEFSNRASSASPPILESSHAKISKPSSAAPLEHDHTYFKRANKKKGKQSRQKIESAVQFMCGDKVMLMQKGKSVGMGTVTEGSNLHGHAILQGYVKVIIDYIQPNTAPVFASSFDNEEMLTAGQFTAWPASYLNRMQSC